MLLRRLVSEKRVKSIMQEAGLISGGGEGVAVKAPCKTAEPPPQGKKSKKIDAKTAAVCSVVGPDYMQVRGSVRLCATFSFFLSF